MYIYIMYICILFCLSGFSKSTPHKPINYLF